ncbi:MAG: hypothetical protein QXG98_00710 [Candidatus Micrarchaeia archaeon]
MLATARKLTAKAGQLAFSLVSFLILRALLFIHDFRRPIALLLYIAGDFAGRARRRLPHIMLSVVTGFVSGTMFLALASAILALSWDTLSTMFSFIPWWALLLALAPLVLYVAFVVGVWAGLTTLMLPIVLRARYLFISRKA